MTFKIKPIIEIYCGFFVIISKFLRLLDYRIIFLKKVSIKLANEQCFVSNQKGQIRTLHNRSTASCNSELFTCKTP